MKRLILTICCFSTIMACMAQAVQPSMMVFPADKWCHDKGFEKIVVKDNGKEIRIQQYENAFVEDQELAPVIQTIGKMMQDRGFQLLDLMQTIKSQNMEEALDNSMDQELEMSAYDKIVESAGPDIALHVDYYTEATGPRVTLYYTLTAFDAYTNKQVASTGLVSYGPVMSTPLTDLVKSALVGSMDAFNSQLMQHFMDMKEMGREVSARINTIAGWEDGLETDVKGQELLEIIEEWMNNNSVAGRYHQKSATESSVYYDSVRIPLYNENGKPIQARQWLNGLRKYLRSLEISSKVKTRGLGQAQLIIGE